MKLVILDTCERVTKKGRSYFQAAFRSTDKAGNAWLGVATIPEELFDYVGEIDRRVVFGNNGSIYVLPY